MYQYRAKVTHVVDGDTLDLQIELGFDVSCSIRVRLYQIDTPETRTKDPVEKEAGFAAKRYVEENYLDKEVIVHTYKDRKGKYGRYLAVLWLIDQYGTANSLNHKLLEEGLAKVYKG